MNLQNLQVVSAMVALAMVTSIAEQARAAEAAKKKDVVDTAAAVEQFSTLVTAVKAAELVDTLKGEGPFTVFAPTNKAFEKISKERLEALLKDKEALTAVLTYHVVPGKVMAADVVKRSEAETVHGEPLKITTKDGKVMINAASVIRADIECTNGVIHVLDGVLVPRQ